MQRKRIGSTIRESGGIRKERVEQRRVLPKYQMNDPKISELTVSELQKLIRQTVQEAVAEVIIEFNAVAEAEEQIRMEAAMTDYLRSTIQGHSFDNHATKLDD